MSEKSEDYKVDNAKLAELQTELEKPFPVEAHSFKPQAVSRNGDRALGPCYVDSRCYQARLDTVDPGWTNTYQIHLTEHQVIIVSTVTVLGRPRSSTGECQLGDSNAVTSAEAQAFKRACAAHGLGRYLYLLPKWWADYDKDSKKFTDNGIRDLQEQLSKALGIEFVESGNGNGHGAVASPPRGKSSHTGSTGVSPTDFWTAARLQVGSGLKYPTREAVQALVQIHTTVDGGTDWESALKALQ